MASGDGTPWRVYLCRTCAHAMTTREREDYVDQCGPCAAAPDLSQRPPTDDAPEGV